MTLDHWAKKLSALIVKEKKAMKAWHNAARNGGAKARVSAYDRYMTIVKERQKLESWFRKFRNHLDLPQID